MEAIGAIGANPLQACEHLHSKIHQLIGELRKIEEGVCVCVYVVHAQYTLIYYF